MSGIGDEDFGPYNTNRRHSSHASSTSRTAGTNSHVRQLSPADDGVVSSMLASASLSSSGGSRGGNKLSNGRRNSRDPSSSSSRKKLQKGKSKLVNGRMMSGKELQEYTKRKGLCPICAERQVEKRVKKGGAFAIGKYEFEPLTVEDENRPGEYKVYKGYCLSNLCYTLEEAKRELNEIGRRDPSLEFNKMKLKMKKKTERKLLESHKEQVDVENNNGDDLIGDRKVASYAQSGQILVPTTHDSTDIPASKKHEPLLDQIRKRREGILEHNLPHDGNQLHSTNKQSISSVESSSSSIAEDIAIRELEELARKNDYHKLITECLCSNFRLPNVVQRAFQLLRNGMYVLYKETGFYGLQSSSSWIKNCLSAMVDYNSNNYVVVADGILMFWSIIGIGDERCIKDITRSSCVDVIVKFMSKYADSESGSGNSKCDSDTEENIILHYGCGFLECLIENQNCGLSIDHPSIEKVIQALLDVLKNSNELSDTKGNSNQPIPIVTNIQAKALAIRALYSLSYQSDELAGRICHSMSESNGFDDLIFIIQHEKARVGIAEWAVRLILRLLHPKVSSNINMTFKSQDLILALIDCVKTSPNQELFYDAAYELLLCLAERRNQNIPTEGIATSIVKEVVRAAESNHDVVGVQLVCIGLLNVLFSDKKNCKHIGATDAVSVVIDIMNKNKKNPEIQSAASIFLTHLAIVDDRSKQIISSKNGIIALVSGFRNFGLVNSTSSNPGMKNMVVEETCTALTALSTSTKFARLIKEAGMLNEIQKYFKEGSNTKIPRSMIALVFNILFFSGQLDAQREVVDDSALDAFLTILRHVQVLEEAECLMTSLLPLSLESTHMLDNLLAYGTLQHILRILEEFPESGPIQKSGCLILGSVYIKIPYNGTLNQVSEIKKGPATIDITTHSEREVKALLSAMDGHKNNESIQIHACDALCNFIAGSFDPVVSSNIDKTDTVISAFSGCLKKVVDAMTIHDNSLDLQRSAMRLLWVLFFLHDEMELKRFTLHFCGKIIDAMGKFRGNDDLYLDACGVLAVLVDDNDSAQFIGQGDGIRMLLRCLQFQNEEIVQLSSTILATLLKNVYTASNEILEIDDSIPTIIMCMMNNAGSSEIQLQCCSTLASLVDLHEFYVNATIASNGGLNACMSAIRKHRGDEEVVESACRALSFGRDAEPRLLQNLRLELGGLLIGILRDYTTNPYILEALLSALWAICIRDEALKGFIGESNGIRLVIDAMKTNLVYEPVQRHACTLFWIMSTFGDNKRKIGREGASCIINAMLTHITSTGLQKEALTAMKNLSTSREEKFAIRSLGGVEAALSSIWVNMSSHHICCAVISVLNNIAVDTSDSSVTNIEHNELDILRYVMKKYPNEEEVQKCACFLLQTYSFNSFNQTLIRNQAGLMDLMATAAAKFPSACQDRLEFVSERIYSSSNNVD